LTASELLKIAHYGKLFKDSSKLDKEFRILTKQWHPDVNKDPFANEVFIHVKELYHQAEEAIKNGNWQTPVVLLLHDIDGKRYRVKYRKHHQFELGDFYVSDTALTYVVDDRFKALFDNFLKITRFKYNSKKMEDEFSRYLPQVIKSFNIPGKKVIIVKKTPNLILLKDIMGWLSTSKEWDRHVAWIISTLLNLKCYLEHSGISHNDISVNTYFVSPIHHSGTLLGGWWYSSSVGAKFHALPKATINILPPNVLSSKIVVKTTDQELIKGVGRSLLGDETGMRLKDKFPEPLVSWLRHSSGKNAFDEYSEWGDILKESFGPRRFVEMDIDADMIYGKEID